ncbi:MAG: beta-lactamase family protein [Novosphingobium sp.]|nr:beta-lactamase family protein [Novosphingobium sp.]
MSADSIAFETPPATVRTANEQLWAQARSPVFGWTLDQKLRGFCAMERMFLGRTVEADGHVRDLPAGDPLPLPAAEVDAYMRSNTVVGLLVLQHGKIRLERYAYGFGPEERWNSFSIAKSVTSLLVGAAIADGSIGSIDDPVTAYVPELRDSAYDGVSLAQLFAMTSGAQWSEDYSDRRSDVARFFDQPAPAGLDPIVAYMRTLKRAAQPGSIWQYNTGETNLIGVVLRRATGRPLSEYLSKTVWKPYGMEADAYWQVDMAGGEISGCCLAIRLRDYGRLGQFVLDGGNRFVPNDWLAAATSQQAETGSPGYGYGYQWWTYPAGRFGAQGIFGQSLIIDPRDGLVMVQLAAWPRAKDDRLAAVRESFWDYVINAARAG